MRGSTWSPASVTPVPGRRGCYLTGGGGRREVGAVIGGGAAQVLLVCVAVRWAEKKIKGTALDLPPLLALHAVAECRCPPLAVTSEHQMQGRGFVVQTNGRPPSLRLPIHIFSVPFRTGDDD
jgi:hypothetical protein